MNVRKKITTLLCVIILLVGICPCYTNAAVIKLNAASKTLFVGGKSTLKITGTAAKKWSSNKNSVVKVSSKGVLTAKKAGTATITCVGKNGKKYTCKVTVKNPYLNASSKTIDVGKTYTLKITGTTAAKWTSSNKNVATVTSKGVVRAKKAGTAKISCKGKNGKTYTCKVTVKNLQDKVYSIDLGGGRETTVSGHHDKKMAKEIFNLVNEYRVQKGLHELKEASVELQNAADIRSYEIANTFSHDRPNGEIGLFAFYFTTGSFAENIAAYQRSAVQVMNAWKNSPGHNMNMLLEEATSLAVGVFAKETSSGVYSYYFVQLFA